MQEIHYKPLVPSVPAVSSVFAVPCVSSVSACLQCPALCTATAVPILRGHCWHTADTRSTEGITTGHCRYTVHSRYTQHSGHTEHSRFTGHCRHTVAYQSLHAHSTWQVNQHSLSYYFLHAENFETKNVFM